MNTNRLVTCIVFLAVFAMAAKVSVDSDTWWHLRAGEWIVQNHAVLHTDPFSYTRGGVTWEYPGWLVEAPMLLLYRLLGPGGLNLWTALMVMVTFLVVWQTLSGGIFLKAFVIILAAATSGVYWAARPYLITFLFTGLFLWILERYRWNRFSLDPSSLPGSGDKTGRSSEKRLWLLPVLMIVWVNSHGGFAIGFVLLGIYWLADVAAMLGKRSWKTPEGIEDYAKPVLSLSLIGFIMVLAVCFNPYGPIMLAYPFRTVSIGALQEFIQEWQSPNFHLVSAQPFIWLWILTFTAVGISRKRLALTDFLLVAVFTYLSLLAWRNVALFALVSPPVLTRHAAPVLDALKQRHGIRSATYQTTDSRLILVNWILLVVLVMAVFVKASMSFPLSANQKVFRETLPVDAIAFIKTEAPAGRLFNSYNWGGYLLWELPEYPVFIDGRTDLYDGKIVEQWLQVVRAEEGWQKVLDQWEVHLVLVEPSVPVVSSLEQNGWNLLYQDERAVVYGR